ncbi:MAG: type II toxin-antitoxin system RelE/ParE family toxin [bacterium]|jgi:plasmid stabilization system protein ParE
MARVELAPGVLDDLDRFIDYLESQGAGDASARIAELIDAIDTLTHSPSIGRPVAGEKRELVIGRRGRGYVALYRYIEPADTVVVLALRSQREAGYAHD